MTDKLPKPDAVCIRRCQPGDFESVVLLLQQLWPNQPLNQTITRGIYDRALNSDSQFYFCAILNQRAVGFASLSLKNVLWPEGPLAHIDELVVESQHRKLGIGTLLLNYLIEEARYKGCRRVELDSSFHRKEAHAFYQRRGFDNRAYIFSKTL